MAIPATVIASIPWRQIIKLAPDVSNAAAAVWSKWASKPKPLPIDSSATTSSQIKEISERIQNLETNEKNQAEVINQLAIQLQGIAGGLKETSEKQSSLLKIAILSMIISTAALITAIASYAR